MTHDVDPPAADELRGMLREPVWNGAAALAREFRAARPFPHVVIDEFFSTAVYRALRAEFPPFDPARAREDSAAPDRRSVREDVRALGPTFARFDDLLGSASFLAWLERVSGLRDPLPDPEHVGGGARVSRTGHEVDPHLDASHHPTRPWRRRLQLIVSFNDPWDESFGGHVELHGDPRDPERDEVRTILALGNRAVLLEASDRSWNALRPVRIPSGEIADAHRSVHVWFYGAADPADVDGAPRGPITVERPLPAALRSGAVVDIDTQLEIVRLTQRRLDHAQRLFEREIAMVRELRRALQEDFPPGHPAASGWVDAVRRLVRTQDELLRFLQDRESGFARLFAEVARLDKPQGLHGLPLFGPVAIMAWEGFWPGDCFVGEHLRVRVHFAEEVTRCTLVGNLPDDAPRDCHLRLRFGDLVEERTFPRGVFSWELAIAGREDTELPLEITCSTPYSYRELGLHPVDDRRLAFQIRSLYFS